MQTEVPWEPVGFELLGEIAETEMIAVGSSIRDVERLRKLYGAGRWRKVKGVATIRLLDGRICAAELHWYEAHGVGRKELKIKRVWDR